MLGRQILKSTSNTNMFKVNRGQLSTGMYIYRISNNGELLYSNKLMVK
ncbi:MAG: T9SS type A sorting domain-containing protein [Aureispira sp.]|nr:T9SS type A sorting domain-containing protein [Aureispira sp.]